jgi:hypothetical protein
MDGSNKVIRPGADDAPVGGPPIIRFLWSRGRLQARSVPALKGRQSVDVLAELRAAPGMTSIIIPGFEAAKVESTEVLTVDTPGQRIILDLREGRMLSIDIATGDRAADARGVREAQLCAAHLVEYYARSLRPATAAATAVRSTNPISSANSKDLLARSLARFEKTQRIEFDDGPTFRF